MLRKPGTETGISSGLMGQQALVQTLSAHPLRAAVLNTDFTMFQRLMLETFLFTAPVYMGLNFTDAGDTTEVVAFVSPNKARFFTLSAEHFFGVEDIYLDVRFSFW